jgi:hypothetical protein
MCVAYSVAVIVSLNTAALLSSLPLTAAVLRDTLKVTPCSIQISNAVFLIQIYVCNNEVRIRILWHQ